MSYLHLNNAPVKEGLIDIQTSLCNPLDMHVDFDNISKKLINDFPVTTNLFQTGVQFNREKGFTPAEDIKVIGKKYSSLSNDKIAQIRYSGITVSKLFPYDNWESLLHQTKLIWDEYHKIFKPERINRIATRFINSIDVRLPFNFNEYFKSPYSLDERINKPLKSYLFRCSLVFEEFNADAIITQSLQPDGTNSEKAFLILDIDVYKVVSYESTDGKIWDDLISLHDIKNEIFFNSITDKLLEKYK